MGLHVGSRAQQACMMLYLKQERKQLLMGLGVVMYVCTHIRTHTYTLLPGRGPETVSEVSLAQD